jgi:hypothetical protein
MWRHLMYYPRMTMISSLSTLKSKNPRAQPQFTFFTEVGFPPLFIPLLFLVVGNGLMYVPLTRGLIAWVCGLPPLFISCSRSRLSVKECDPGRPLGGYTKTYYNSIQNLKQVRMSSKEESTSTNTKIVDDNSYLTNYGQNAYLWTFETLWTFIQGIGCPPIS